VADEPLNVPHIELELAKKLCRRKDQGSRDRGHRTIMLVYSIELKRTSSSASRITAMPKFANVVTIEVAQGRRDQFLPLLAAHKARSLKDKPGTLQFEILLPKDDDTKVVSYEVYRDDTAFEIHRNGPSLARLREEIAGMVVNLHGTRCAVVH
jgi:quinol monooxygenase YgiN